MTDSEGLWLSRELDFDMEVALLREDACWYEGYCGYLGGCGV